MNAEELFRANFALVKRVVASVSRRAGLRDDEAEEFLSIVNAALIDNDYAILRTYEGRAPLGAFLTVVVQRLLSREWMRVHGRWRASAEAERLGPAAVLLEKLMTRDGRSLEEAAPIVRNIDPSLDLQRVRELAGRLPPRPARPRLVPLIDSVHEPVASESADARVHESDNRRQSETAARVVRETIAALPLQDRMLMRFHFGAGLSIADAARMLGVPQRPLYRRAEALLRLLREALQRAGLGREVAGDLISACGAESFDFGLHDGKTEPGWRTSDAEGK